MGRKNGIGFQYMLNEKRSPPAAEVLGLRYKTVLKPALDALADETKRASIAKLDESVCLQKQLQGNAKIVEEKMNNLSCLQVKINEMVAFFFTSLDLETGNHVSRCATDARQMKEELERKEHHLSTAEKESENFRKILNRGCKMHYWRRTNKCATELLQSIDSIADYEELMETSVSGMKKYLHEAADGVTSFFTVEDGLHKPNLCLFLNAEFEESFT